MSSIEKQISVQNMHQLKSEEREDFWDYFGKEWEKEQREKIEREKKRKEGELNG